MVFKQCLHFLKRTVPIHENNIWFAESDTMRGFLLTVVRLYLNKYQYYLTYRGNIKEKYFNGIFTP